MKRNKKMASSTTIESLPREVLLHVFSFMSPIFLCETVAQVSDSWEDLCKDPLLYKAFDFRGDDFSTATVFKLLRRAPLLKALTLADCDNMEAILEEVCLHNKKIRALTLEEVREPFGVSLVMKKIIENCTCLETLMFHGWIVRDWVFLEDLCVQLPYLKTLHFDQPWSFSHESVIIPLVNSCFHLQDLLLYNNSRDCESADNTVALCNRFCKTLRSFKLGFGFWSREAFFALQNFDRLETLGILEPHSMTDEGLMSITLIPTLRHLALTYCQVPEATWIRLFASGAWTNLVSLDLNGSRVCDEVGVAISVHLKNLETIVLSGRDWHAPELTATGVRSVVQGCSKLQVVKLFNLEHTIIEASWYIPDHLPGLKKLVVIPCSPIAVSHIKARMPWLQFQYN